MELFDGMPEPLGGMLRDALLNKQRHNCSTEGCQPAAVFKLSVTDTTVVAEMDELSARARRLHNEYETCIEILEAKRTLFWAGIRERTPEYKDAYRATLRANNTEVAIFTDCASCNTPTPEED